jgi:hypothetical protein
MCKERSGSEERQSVSAIIIIIIINNNNITSIVSIIISLLLFHFPPVCSNVYSSYLVVGILTNYYDFLLGDRLSILFSKPSPYTYTLLSTLMLLKSVH